MELTTSIMSWGTVVNNVWGNVTNNNAKIDIIIRYNPSDCYDGNGDGTESVLYRNFTNRRTNTYTYEYNYNSVTLQESTVTDLNYTDLNKTGKIISVTPLTGLPVSLSYIPFPIVSRYVYDFSDNSTVSNITPANKKNVIYVSTAPTVNTINLPSIFAGFVNVHTIDCGFTVTYITSYVFAECKNVTKLIVSTSVTYWGSKVTQDLNIYINIIVRCIQNDILLESSFIYNRLLLIHIATTLTGNEATQPEPNYISIEPLEKIEPGYSTLNLSGSIITNTLITSSVLSPVYSFASISRYIYDYNDLPRFTLTSGYRPFIYIAKIPDGINTIATGTFSGCVNLYSIEIPDTVTTVGNASFNFCSSLLSISMKNVTSIGFNSFINCTKLNLIVFPNIQTIGNTSFGNCTNLKNIKLPDTLISIGNNAFAGSTLVSITIPSSVTSIGDLAFANITNSLTYVDMSSCNLNYLGNNVFYNNQKLQTVLLPKTLTDISDNVFYKCTNLKTITLPNTLTSIGDNAFYSCSVLPNTFTIPNNVRYIGNTAFYGCITIPYIILPTNLTTIGTEAFTTCEKISYVIIPKNVTTIGTGIFKNCRDLSYVIFPNKINNSFYYNSIFGVYSLDGGTATKNLQKVFIRKYITEDPYNQTYEDLSNNITVANISPRPSIIYYNIPEPPSFIQTSPKLYSIDVSFNLGDTNESGQVTNVEYMIDDTNSETDEKIWVKLAQNIVDGTVPRYFTISQITSSTGTSLLSSDKFYAVYLRQYTENGGYSDDISYNTTIRPYSDTQTSFPQNITLIPAETSIRLQFYLGNTNNSGSVTVVEYMINTDESSSINWIPLTRNTHYNDTSGQVVISSNITPDIYYNITMKQTTEYGGTSNVSIAENTRTYSINKPDSPSITSAIQGLYNIYVSFTLGNTNRSGDISSVEYQVDASNANNWTTIEKNVDYNTTDGTGTFIVSLSTLTSSPTHTVYIRESSLYGATYSDISSAVVTITSNRILYISTDIATPSDVLSLLSTSTFTKHNRNIYKKTLETTIFDTSILPSAIKNYITNIDIPNYITNIDTSAFTDCSNITSIILPNNITHVGDTVFTNCTRLTSIQLSTSIISWGSNVTSNNDSIDISINYISDEGNYKNSYIYGILSELNYRSISPLVISDSNYDINDSSKFVAVTPILSNEDNILSFSREIIPISRYIYNYSDITNVKPQDKKYIIRANIPSSTTSIGSSDFSGCSNLQYITIPNNVMFVGDNTFNACNRLKMITLSTSVISWGSSVTSNNSLIDISINYISSEGDGTESIIYKKISPLGYNTVSRVPISNGILYGYSADISNSFISLINLSLDIPSVNPTTYSEISRYVYPYSNNNITSVSDDNKKYIIRINIPTTNVLTIGDSDFSGCSSLTNVYIPNNVTSIGTNAFSGCSNLYSIALSTRITSIPTTSFEGCTDLSAITIRKYPSDLSNIITDGIITPRGIQSQNITTVIISDSPSITNLSPTTNSIDVSFNLGATNGVTVVTSITKVQYRLDELNDEWITLSPASYDTTPDSFTIPLLNSNTPYTIYMRQYTDEGDYSYPDSSKNTMTYSTMQPEPPSLLPSILTSRSITINFYYGDTNNSGNITTIEYFINLPDFRWTTLDEEKYTARSFTIQPLQPASNYTIRMRQNTRFGITSSSELEYPIITYSETQPVPPSVYPSYGFHSIYVSFEIGSTLDSGDISGIYYTIKESRDNDDDWSLVNPLNYDDTSGNFIISLSSLETLSTYTVYMKESTLYGGYSEVSSDVAERIYNNTFYLRFSQDSGLVDNYIDIIAADGTTYTFTKYDNYTYSKQFDLSAIPNGFLNTYDKKQHLVEIEIPIGISIIGNDAFNGCSSLSSVNIPNSVSIIGNSAFNGTNINKMELSTSVISWGTNVTGTKRDIDISINYISSEGNGTESIIYKRLTTLGYTRLSIVSIPNNIVNGYDASIENSFISLIDLGINGIFPSKYSAISRYVYPYNHITSVSSDNKKYIIRVNIPNTGVNSIVNDTFSGCSSLLSITIPNSVTIIGNNAFNGCNNLSYFVIPTNVTSIGDSAFSGCSSLPSITIPSNVTTIGNSAFSGCSSLSTEIRFPNSVISIGNSVFSGCSSLPSVIIPSFEIDTIGDAFFYNCTSLHSITITVSITSISENAFFGCTNLHNVYISKYISDSITTLSSLLNTRITTLPLTITTYDISSPPTITKLTPTDKTITVTYKLGERTDVVKSIAYDVNGENEWTSIDIGDDTLSLPNKNKERTLLIPRTLSSDTVYTIYMRQYTEKGGQSYPDSSGNTRTYSNIAPDTPTITTSRYGFHSIYVRFNVEGTNRSGDVSGIYYTIKDSHNNENDWTLINKANYDDTSGNFIISLSLTDTEESYTVYMRKSSLYGGYSVDASQNSSRIYDDTCYLKFDGSVTNDTINVSTYTFTKYDTNTYSCKFIGSGITISQSFFSAYKTNLVELELPNNVTSLGDYALGGYTKLHSFKIPVTVISIGSNLFNGCTSLTNIEMSTNILSIPDGMFADCSSLSLVTLPTSIKRIGGSAFANCGNIYSIVIPDNVTYIGNNAFIRTKLSSIVIPNKVTFVDFYAFVETNITHITLSTSIVSWNTEATSNNHLIDININYIANEDNVTNSYIYKKLNEIVVSGTTYKYKSLSPVKIIPPETYKLDYPNTIVSTTDFGFSTDLSFHNISRYIYSYTDSLMSYINTGLINNIKNTYYIISVNILNTKRTIELNAFYYYYSNLYSVTIPSSVTVVGNNAFKECIRLKYITLSTSIISWGSSVTSNNSSIDISINYISSEGDGTESIIFKTLPQLPITNGYKSVSRVPISSDIVNGYSADISNSFISLIDLGITDVTPTTYSAISRYVYPYNNITLVSSNNKQNIIRVNIPTTNVLSIGPSDFLGCSSLTNVYIPNSVISIGTNAFSGCSNLYSIALSTRITSIPSTSFNGCVKLTAITIRKYPSDLSNIITTGIITPRGIQSRNITTVIISYPPSNIYLTPTTNSIDVSFNLGTTNGATVPPITNVQYRLSELNEWISLLPSSYATTPGSFTIPSLDSDKPYTVYMRQYTDQGDYSYPDSSKNTMTYINNQPEPPSLVSSSRTSNSITIEFEYGDTKKSGNITTIEYNKNGSEWIPLKLSEYNAKSFTIEPLDPSSNYIIQMHQNTAYGGFSETYTIPTITTYSETRPDPLVIDTTMSSFTATDITIVFTLGNTYNSGPVHVEYKLNDNWAYVPPTAYDSINGSFTIPAASNSYYIIKMRQTTDYGGHSFDSYDYSIKTYSQIPPEYPIIQNVTPSINSIDVSFNLGDTNNSGIITTVQYACIEENTQIPDSTSWETLYSNIPYDNDTKFFTINVTDSFKKYLVFMRQTTFYGGDSVDISYNTAIQPYSNTPPNPPTIQNARPNAYSIDISFNLGNPNYSGSITHVQYACIQKTRDTPDYSDWKNVYDENANILYDGTTRFFTTIEPLDSTIEYKIFMRQSTLYGNYSVDVSYNTTIQPYTDSPPDKPTITYIYGYLTKIEAFFTLGSTNNSGNITRLQYSYKTSLAGSIYTNWQDINYNDDRFTISGLSPSTEYTIQIIQSTIYGRDSAIEYITIKTLDTTQFTLKFMNNYSDSITIRGYTFTHRGNNIYTSDTFHLTTIPPYFIPDDKRRTLIEMTLPTTVIDISDNAFLGCGSLTSVFIPVTVESIGNRAFLGCNSLPSLIIPYSVNYIGHSAFLGCTELLSITIPSRIQSIQYRTFLGCNNLQSVNVNTIPNIDITYIGDGAFLDCNDLVSMPISTSCMYIGNRAFLRCKSLTGTTIPDSIVYIGYNAFNGCSSLGSLIIPTHYSTYTQPTQSTFVSNKPLSSISESSPSSLLHQYSTISRYVYDYATIGTITPDEKSSILTINIVSDTTIIQSGQFSGYNNLLSVSLPNTITSIGSNAFTNCPKLNALIIYNIDGTITIDTNAFTGSSIGIITIHKYSTSNYDLLANVKNIVKTIKPLPSVFSYNI